MKFGDTYYVVAHPWGGIILLIAVASAIIWLAARRL